MRFYAWGRAVGMVDYRVVQDRLVLISGRYVLQYKLFDTVCYFDVFIK